MTTVAEKLQEVMDWKGLKQPDVSRLTGISKTMVGDYLRGYREPTLEALRKLAAALDVTPWMLINGEPMSVKDFELSKDERQIVGTYRTLSGRSRRLISTTVQTLGEVEHGKHMEG